MGRKQNAKTTNKTRTTTTAFCPAQTKNPATAKSMSTDETARHACEECNSNFETAAGPDLNVMTDPRDLSIHQNRSMLQF
mmetsp:Transcript_4307/g.10783  ORF Transcript_4307/g.10783 Transcript_4307/m.10783 type:complete len:80 (-) Transcript_4307:1097-1336(-)